MIFKNLLDHAKTAWYSERILFFWGGILKTTADVWKFHSRTETANNRVFTIKATTRTFVLAMRNIIKASILLRKICIKAGIRGLSTGNDYNDNMHDNSHIADSDA